MNPNKMIEIIGVPLDLGANIAGSSLGPQAFRNAGLCESLSSSNIPIIANKDIEIPSRETLSCDMRKKKYLPVIKEVCQILSKRTYSCLDQGNMPLIIGGDHSLAIGSISGIKKWHHEKGKSLGVVWFDAHADLNTPQTSTSQNIHGMPAAVLMGYGDPDLTSISAASPYLTNKEIALLGLRAVDSSEKDFLSQQHILHYPMKEIREQGMSAVMTELVSKFVQGFDAIHISFDIDGIDPHYAPGVSTPVGGGLQRKDVEIALQVLARTKKISSIEFVELNPLKDIDHKTALLAIQLIQTALGQ
jgi:arginase